MAIENAANARGAGQMADQVDCSMAVQLDSTNGSGKNLLFLIIYIFKLGG